MPLYIEKCLVIPQMVSQIFEQYMHLILAIVLKKYLCKSTINDGGKKYLCKSTIDNDDLVGEEIHVYTKFTYITELNNIWIGTWTSF